MTKSMLLALAMVLLPSAAGAEEPLTPNPATAKQPPKSPPALTDDDLKDLRALKQDARTGIEAAASEAALKDDREQKFAGFSFGAGIGATLIHRAREARIDEVELVGEPSVVRVKKRTRVPTRMLLESHYFWTFDQQRYGFGPFLAVQAGSQDVVEAIGFGLMLGLRRGNSSNSFNLGVGGLVDTSSPVLAKGIVEGQPLPAGETAIRIEQRSVFSWLLMFSFSF